MTSEEKRIRHLEAVKAWKTRNPEKVKEQLKRYHLKHRNQRLTYMKAHYKEITDKAKAYDRIMEEREKSE